MGEGEAAQRPDVYASLRYPNFKRYIVCLFCFTLGIQIQGTVVGWQVYDLTHDPREAHNLVGEQTAVAALLRAKVQDYRAE